MKETSLCFCYSCYCWCCLRCCYSSSKTACGFKACFWMVLSRKSYFFLHFESISRKIQWIECCTAPNECFYLSKIGNRKVYRLICWHDCYFSVRCINFNMRALTVLVTVFPSFFFGGFFFAYVHFPNKYPTQQYFFLFDLRARRTVSVCTLSPP